MEAHVDEEGNSYGLSDTLADKGESPLETFAHEEVRARVEQELKQVPEPYRTTVVLRDIEGLAYEEIAEVLQISLGTVKSRLIRGREALKKRLEDTFSFLIVMILCSPKSSCCRFLHYTHQLHCRLRTVTFFIAKAKTSRTSFLGPFASHG